MEPLCKTMLEMLLISHVPVGRQHGKGDTGEVKKAGMQKGQAWGCLGRGGQQAERRKSRHGLNPGLPVHRGHPLQHGNRGAKWRRCSQW